ncbi:hypothetical protein ASG60_11075 [Methylobacterium sp. Leaf469]|jgi:hypothetical protein|nr:hypothetical protein ASF25_20125 [Methylobacterium sp. Leaf100]KQT90162.1 hypothetical protein ASG60_11075 [Methylobacterium sp. Leaf469]
MRERDMQERDMVDQRDKLRASRSAAVAAKDAFAAQYISGRVDCSVGLGVNERGDDWTMRVFAHSPAAAQALPDHFGEFDVEVEITGPAVAF